MKLNPLTCKDFYKAGHIYQYPKGTTLVYSNFTARSDKLFKGSRHWDGKLVFFGLQGFIQWFLKDLWDEEFFRRNKDEVLRTYQRRMDTALGEGVIKTDHLAALHDLGYLPLRIRALPEGSRVPMRVPVFTIENTLPEFYWLTNYLETAISAENWKACTTATIAYEYRRLLNDWCEKTGGDPEFVQFQGHDFSMRGLPGLHASAYQAGHLLSFAGTDTPPAIDFLENYYGADARLELVGVSVSATEHSVMCMDGHAGEFETFKRLITETYPTGIVSIVADTWNLWTVLTDYLPRLKKEIMARDGKVVIRPDSGDPADILCGSQGQYTGRTDTPAQKAGVIQLLWDTFGGRVNGKGYSELDPHIGAIYGDSITLDRADDICHRLRSNGFASTNVVFGIGSFTYTYNTRDTFGFAVKSTYGEINGEGVEIFKDPVTDDGIKKSAKGLLRVYKLEQGEGDYALADQRCPEQLYTSELKDVFNNGVSCGYQTFAEIKARLAG